MNSYPSCEMSRLTWLLNWEESYPMAAGSKAGSWLFSAKEKTEHSLVVPMFWSFLCAPMPAAETKPRSQLASAVVKSFWRTFIVFFCCDLVTFCLWLCRLGVSMWLVYDFFWKQNWGYFALLPRVVQTLNLLQKLGWLSTCGSLFQFWSSCLYK